MMAIVRVGCFPVNEEYQIICDWIDTEGKGGKLRVNGATAKKALAKCKETAKKEGYTDLAKWLDDFPVPSSW